MSTTRTKKTTVSGVWLVQKKVGARWLTIGRVERTGPKDLPWLYVVDFPDRTHGGHPGGLKRTKTEAVTAVSWRTDMKALKKYRG